LSRGPRRWAVAGIDLAWGERRPDGICLLHGEGKRVASVSYALTRGDDALLTCLQDCLAAVTRTLLCLDAPVVCPNRRGARPVDRLTHRLFHRVQAAAHPANRDLAVRPLRVVRRLQRAGYDISTDWPAKPRAMIEVFPHPATVRWFGLDRTIKYKRGPVDARRREFARLQRLLRAWLADNVPDIAQDRATIALLRTRWTKDTEDLTDALLCAVIGWQWAVRGRRSLEVLGDLRTGFIVVPSAKQPG
jgi:predicted RNase H-like nuclease